MGKILIGWILKIPMILIMLLSVIASSIAVVKGVEGVKMYVPISCLVVFVLYILGEVLHKDRGKD